MLCSESLRYADGIPVIYCYDILPYWLIKDIGDLITEKCRMYGRLLKNIY